MGIDPEVFWRLTPYLTRLAIETGADRARDDHRENLTVAWHGAAFERARRLPALDDLLRSLEPSKPRSSDELFNKIVAINAAFGGDVIHRT